MRPPHHGTPSELRLLHQLIDSFDGSQPSQAEVEKGLESGLARLMFLEGRMREHAGQASGTPPREEPCEEHDFVEEIRALREAVAKLRACTSAGDSAVIAHGFVLRRKA
jgi:hypothetical protein